MNSAPLNLDSDLHLRIPAALEHQLKEVAAGYHMKKSTLARIVLQQNLNNYNRNKLWFQLALNRL